MKKKPLMGRPPKGDKSRTARINMRAEPAVKKRYELAAGLSGLSLTDWAKEQLDEAARRALGD